MQVNISGKQLDVGKAMRIYVEDALKNNIDKYFGKAIEANVVLSPAPHHKFQADVSIHVGHGINVQGRSIAGDVHIATDEAIEKITRQLLRYKTRLRDHHRDQAAKIEHTLFTAQQYVLSPEVEEDTYEGNQASASVGTAEEETMIIAEEALSIPSLKVSDAVMRMNLANAAFFLFRNEAHDRLNIVYRREDGHIGWIDPQAV